MMNTSTRPRTGQPMASNGFDEAKLAEAFSIIDETPDVEVAVAELRDLIGVDHLVYHSSKLGTSPSVDPYIRLTYPAAWIKRYLQMGYVDVDPVLREGFSRTLPFDWSELKVGSEKEMSFMLDALAHGVGPFGLSIPLRSKRGHRGLFSLSSAGSEEAWKAFRKASLPPVIDVGNRLHRRVIREVFGEEHIHLTGREVECLHWTSLGKDAGEIAAILQISPHTVRDFLKSARFKLDCASSAQAVSKATKLGLLVL
jgi:LuxR family transcriptional regulator, quorum-sensing system regulator CinR